MGVYVNHDPNVQDLANKINQEANLHVQVIYDDPKCFESFMAHYGKFTGVCNYIALVGKKSSNLEEILGYYGEMMVLEAQKLGLNTCWERNKWNCWKLCKIDIVLENIRGKIFQRTN